MNLIQIETYYRIAFDASYIMMQLLAGISLFFICRNFFLNKKYSWLPGIVYAAVIIFIYYIPLILDNFMVYFLGVFAAFLSMLYADKGNTKMKVFIAFIFFSVRWLGMSITIGITTLLSLTHEEAVQNSVDEFFLFCRLRLIDLILTAAVLLLLVYVLNKIFIYKYSRIGIRELCMLITPSISGMFIYAVFRAFTQIYVTETGSDIFFIHPQIQILWILNNMVLTAAILIAVILFQNLKKRQEEEKNAIVLQSQMKDIQSHINEVERIYSGIRGVKHDINNHISVMKSLLEQRNYNEAAGYLKTMQESVKVFDYEIKTGNPVTDVIINEKAEEAKRNNIIFKSGFQYPVNNVINAFDISILLNNALSNAIEASPEGGRINIRSFQEKSVFIISVSNDYHGKLIINEENGLPETNKADKVIHGYGMGNIKSVTEKYNGDMELIQEGSQIKLTIMLSIPLHQKKVCLQHSLKV